MEPIYKTETGSRCRNKLMVSGGEWEWGGINWETGIDIYTLLYIKETANKDLLCSIRNSSQYCIIIYIGKESKNEWIYDINPLCCTPETNTIL